MAKTSTTSAPSASNNDAPAVDSFDAGRLAHLATGLVTSLRTARANKSAAARARETDRVRMNAGAAWIAASADPSAKGVRVAVDVETAQRGGGTESSRATFPALDVLRSVALNVPLCGSTRLAK